MQAGTLAWGFLEKALPTSGATQSLLTQPGLNLSASSACAIVQGCEKGFLHTMYCDMCYMIPCLLMP